MRSRFRTERGCSDMGQRKCGKLSSCNRGPAWRCMRSLWRRFRRVVSGCCLDVKGAGASRRDRPSFGFSSRSMALRRTRSRKVMLRCCRRSPRVVSKCFWCRVADERRTGLRREGTIVTTPIAESTRTQVKVNDR